MSSSKYNIREMDIRSSLSSFFIYSVLQGGGVIVLVVAVDVVVVLTTAVDVVVGMTATGVVAVVIGVTTPPAGVAAPPHTIAGGRVTETASQALG